MRSVSLLVAAALLAVSPFVAACAKDARTATTGDRVLDAYVRDLNTGKCIRLQTYHAGRFDGAFVAAEAYCQGRGVK